jgi:hypothetical protein
LIDYFKNCIAIHPEWKNFGFDFSDTSTYEDISGFYREVELQGYKIDWTYISEKDIDLLQEKGQLYLFQIYNKDFSKKSTGNDNLHTMYLKNLFSEENLKDIVLKLNGEAEIFFRKSSIKNPIIHKKGSILVNRTYEAEEKDQFGNIQIVRKTIPENIYQELYKYFNDKSDKELSDEAAKLKNVVGHYYMGYLPWDKPAKIEVVSGAFCMIRREALLKVGLLDEDFFMYGEDIDLSYRILKGGYQNYYLPVDILHYKGESTQKSSFRYVHVFYEAMLIFFRKHYSGMSHLLSIPIKFAIYARASVAFTQMMTARIRKSLGFFSPSHVDLSNQVLFDADEMSYEEMLHQLAQRSDENIKLATYTKDIGKVITDREVMDKDEFGYL